MRARLENTPGTCPRDALHNTARARRGRDREKLLARAGNVVDVKLLNAGRRVDLRGADKIVITPRATRRGLLGD